MCCLRQFLHPSEDDSYRLVRFLVERLSEISEGRKTLTAGDIASRPKMETFRDISDDMMVNEDKDETFDMHIQKVEAVLKDLTMTSEKSHSSDSLAKNTSANVDFSSQKTDDPVTDVRSDLSLRDSSRCEENSYEDPFEVLFLLLIVTLSLFSVHEHQSICLNIYIGIVILNQFYKC